MHQHTERSMKLLLCCRTLPALTAVCNGCLQIEDTPEHFRTVIKAGGIMDVVEQYPWSGKEQQHSRRDKRSGHHLGKVVRSEQGPAIQ